MVSYYRIQMLKDLGEFVKKIKDISEIILSGDINEAIDSSQFESFLLEHALFDIHRQFNDADSNLRESTYEYGKKCVDVYTTLGGLMQYVD